MDMEEPTNKEYWLDVLKKAYENHNGIYITDKDCNELHGLIN